jgi:hypothetical protein
MAPNGKADVNALEIGATVAITLKGAGTVEGAVYTVDPVTKTVILFSPAEKPVTQDSRDVRLVPHHAIQTIKVLKPADAADKKALVAPLPCVDVSACRKREEDAFEAMESAMAMLNPTASASGQACFDALSKTLDCSWNGDAINVLDQVRVDPPYTEGSCVSLDGNKASLGRIQKILAAGLKKTSSADSLAQAGR